jgi:phospholipase/carboxylesterase
MNRRAFLAASGAALAVWSCSNATAPRLGASDELVSRPHPPTRTLNNGSHTLGLGTSPLPGVLPPRDGILYIPPHSASTPIPLLVLLHGSGGAASNWFGSYAQRADAHRFAMLAIDSRDYTWDLFTNAGYGPDVRFMDKALAWTFDRVSVDPQRVALVGFSDGASYALSLGLSNGGLFSRVVAYSGCIVASNTMRGKPQLFVSHGVQDGVLPIAACSRSFVSTLLQEGDSVEYEEFPGGHEVPGAISAAAMDWLDASWKT